MNSPPSMISQPLVSVIIPTFNRVSVLARAINSVLNQTMQNFDLWIIDDGSTDETAVLIDQLSLELSLESAQRVHYHKMAANLGVSRARNWGVQLSQAPFLAFLDSDDEWLPQRLQWQLQLRENYPTLRLIHGEEIWMRKGIRVNPMLKHQKFGGDIFEKCLPLCLISPSAVLLERSLLEEVGGFREDYPVCEDYDLWLKITSLYEVGFVEKPIIKKYGGHLDQLSQKYPAMDYWRVKSLQEIYLSRPQLSHEKKRKILGVIKEKSKILLKGFAKHKNNKNLAEIREIVEWESELSGGRDD